MKVLAAKAPPYVQSVHALNMQETLANPLPHAVVSVHSSGPHVVGSTQIMYVAAALRVMQPARNTPCRAGMRAWCVACTVATHLLLL